MFKLIYKLLGWKVTRFLPDDVKQCVAIVAPHTSNWDFLFGMGAVGVMKLHPHFVIKKEWIRWPIRRMMLSFGAVPIDRNAKNADGERKSTVDTMADLFKTHERLRLFITPEGTRSRMEKWRTGFYHVAVKAGVPLALAFIDYEKKECGIADVFYPTGDYKADMKRIMDFYKTLHARYPENFSVDVELSKN